MNTSVPHCPQHSSTHTLGALLSRYFWLIVSVVASVQMVGTMVVDFRRKMWIDELYTLLIANQKSIGEIVKATIEGCDGAPPIYAILVHALLPLIPNEEFAVRLPSTIGYGAMVLLIAAFFRRVFSASYALAAVFLTCLCTFEYAFEGRGYGVVLGFAGSALFFWRNMAENKPSAWSRAFFVLSAAMMTAFNFVAILFFVPLFIADLVQGRRRGGRMNWMVWTAAAAAIVIVLCMHYSIIVTFHKFMQYTWAKAQWKFFPDAVWLNNRTKYAYGLGIALFVIAFLLHRYRFKEAAKDLLDEYVWTAFLLYYLSPAMLFAVFVYTTHGFVNRYTVWMSIGAAGLVIGLFALAAKCNERTGIVLAGLLSLAVMAAPMRKAIEKPRLIVSEEAMKEAAGLPHDNTVVVVADHHVFMELYHYAPKQLHNRLVYSLARDLDIRYLGFDTGALLMDAIRKRFHLPIVDYKEILERYDRFYVVSSLEHYLPSMLHKDGRSVRLLQVDTNFALYLVLAGKDH